MLARAIEPCHEDHAAAHAGPGFEQAVERVEAAHDVLRRLDAVVAKHHEPVPDRVRHRVGRDSSRFGARDVLERLNIGAETRSEGRYDRRLADDGARRVLERARPSRRVKPRLAARE